MRLVALFILFATTIFPQVAIVTISRQPVEALRSVTKSLPAGTALYSVRVRGVVGGKVTVAQVEQAMESAGIAIVDQRLDQGTVERTRGRGKFGAVLDVASEVGEVATPTIPALQAAKFIKGSPWISGGTVVGGFVLSRIQRARQARRDPVVTIGQWLQLYGGSEVAAGGDWPRLFTFGSYDRNVLVMRLEIP